MPSQFCHIYFLSGTCCFSEHFLGLSLLGWGIISKRHGRAHITHGDEMASQWSNRNKLMISSSALLITYSIIKLMRIIDNWNDSIFSELMINSIADSLIMIGLGTGLIIYCATSLHPSTDTTAGEWVDSKGIKWRRTNGGGLFWWDGEEWKLF